MASLNKVMLIGNLTRKPEVRYTPAGKAVCDFSIAINSSWKTDSGQKREEVTFVDCTAWNKTAEIMEQFLEKGSPIYVEGKLTTETWEDKTTGAKKTKTKVTIEVVQFLSGPREAREPQQRQERPIAEQLRQRNQPSPPAADGMDEDLDEIPF